MHLPLTGRLHIPTSGLNSVGIRPRAPWSRRAGLVPVSYAKPPQQGTLTSTSSHSQNAGRRAKLTQAPVTNREVHKIFDEVFITVRAGDGGNGEIVQHGVGKEVPNHKYRPGANQPKKMWLPASEPAEGADGGDVVLVCDHSVDALTHLHARSAYCAPKGSNANPAAGSMGPKNNAHLRKAETPPLEVPVPPGTVVKRKGTGQFLGELLSPGDRLLVVRGGRGGRGVQAPSRQKRLRDHSRQLRRSQQGDSEVVEVADINWKEDSRGLPGAALSLHLLLRVVADIGIVGFPNAGKSSLLAALTRAKPEIASYPFTTLMPNLGVLFSGSQGPRPVLADLPGLIDGAHNGRGLGRMFLRHLRRTRAILQVVDCAAADPAADYWAVREELRMYNPQYCVRPHVVVLNKVDLMAAQDARGQVVQAIAENAVRFQAEYRGKLGSSRDDGVAWEGDEPSLPVAVVCVSAVHGLGLDDLSAAIRRALSGERGMAGELRSASPNLYVGLEGHGGDDVASGGGVGQSAAHALASSTDGHRTGVDAYVGADGVGVGVGVGQARGGEGNTAPQLVQQLDYIFESEGDEEGELEEGDLQLLQMSDVELLALELD